MSSRRRVVVTGVGVLSHCGIGQEAVWKSLLEASPEGSPRRIENFDPAPYFANPKETRRQDRFSQFAIACAHEALENSGDPSSDPSRIGVHLGTGVGGLGTIEEQVQKYYTKGPKKVSPFLVPMLMANAAAAAISIKYGYRGPCETTTTACAASTQAIGNAVNTIRSGRCDVMLTGGSEASNTPTGEQGFINMTAVSSSGISCPFDKRRDGFVHSEGGAILVIEEMEYAKQRGAKLLAEITGYATNADAHHITAPSPQGKGAMECMQMALQDAGIEPDDIKHINAHGTSTPLNDANEATAILKIFGSPGPAVTSTKGVTGHALGASGAIEAVAVVLAMKNGILPPTACYQQPDPELAAIRIVAPDPEPWTPGPALSNSFGFGGHNATLVFEPIGS